MPLPDALQVFESAVRRINVAYGTVGETVKKKCVLVIANNPGFETIKIKDNNYWNTRCKIG